MNDKLTFIPTSMVDLESLPESVGDVIYKNANSKLILKEGSPGINFPDNGKGNHYTTPARSGAAHKPSTCDNEDA